MKNKCYSCDDYSDVLVPIYLSNDKGDMKRVRICPKCFLTYLDPIAYLSTPNITEEQAMEIMKKVTKLK